MPIIKRQKDIKKAVNATRVLESGVATLVAGAATVPNASVTANAIVRVTHKTRSGTRGALFVGTVTAGTSFAINSTSSSDTSVVFYEILAY